MIGQFSDDLIGRPEVKVAAIPLSIFTRAAMAAPSHKMQMVCFLS